MKRLRDAAVTVAGLVPFAVAWIEKVILHPRPFWAAYSDPELFFFYDGLRLLRGDPPANIDHPGTPFQLLAAACAAVTGRNPLDVDRYRLAMYAVTAVLVIAATFFLVRSRLLRDLPPSMQIATLWTFWLAPAALRHIVIASPETVELPFGALAAAALIAFHRDRTRRQAMFLGAAIGVLIAVKFVFLTWLFAAGVAASFAGGPAFRDRLRSAATIGASAGIAFLLATLPAAARWSDMLRWMTGLALRDRWYGDGAIAPPSLADTLRSVATAVAAAKAWHLWLAFSLGALAIACWRKRELAFPLLFSVTAVVLNFALAAKGLIPTAAEGFGDIRYRYLLPSALVAMIALAIAIREWLPGARVVHAAVLILAGVAVGKTMIAEVRTNAAIVAHAHEERAALEAALASLRHPDDVVVYFWTPEPSFHLRYPTFGRRFMARAVLTRVSGDAGPGFDPRFLGMIERRYANDGHFYAQTLSLPSGRTRWDLFVEPEQSHRPEFAASAAVVGRAHGYIILRNPQGRGTG